MGLRSSKRRLSSRRRPARSPGNRRLTVRDLGISEQAGDDSAEAGWLRRFRINLSLFLAGMYTGESCAGTPRGPRDKAPDERVTDEERVPAVQTEKIPGKENDS